MNPPFLPPVICGGESPNRKARKRYHFHVTDRQENFVTSGITQNGEIMTAHLPSFPKNTVRAVFSTVDAELLRELGERCEPNIRCRIEAIEGVESLHVRKEWLKDA